MDIYKHKNADIHTHIYIYIKHTYHNYSEYRE